MVTLFLLEFKKWRMWSLVHEGPKKKIFFRKKVIYPPHSLYNILVNRGWQVKNHIKNTWLKKVKNLSKNYLQVLKDMIR